MTNKIFYQLFEKSSSTYTYIIADKKTMDAVIIDPVIETLQRDLDILKENNLNLKYILETHIHADHITSASKLKELTGAKLVYGKNTNLNCADLLLDEDEQLILDSLKIKAILTPGHTDGCTTYKIDNMLFTGDTLLINSCGRTDFQQGDSKKLFESISKLYKLEDSTIVYPAHNYEGITHTTIGLQKKFNNFLKLNTTQEEFIDAMNKRDLPLPKKIKESVPANINCGNC